MIVVRVSGPDAERPYCTLRWFDTRLETTDDTFPDECLELAPTAEPPRPEPESGASAGELLKAICTLQRDNADLGERLERAMADRRGAVECARGLLPGAVLDVADADARHAMGNVVGAYVTMKNEANAQLARMAERIAELESR